MSGRIRLARAILEPLFGSSAVMVVTHQLVFWYGRRSDLSEGIWREFGYQGFFGLSLLNGLAVWALGRRAWLVTSVCWLVLALWWLHPLGMFPFRAPFYLTICTFWLLWPYWVLRSDRASEPEVRELGLNRESGV